MIRIDQIFICLISVALQKSDYFMRIKIYLFQGFILSHVSMQDELCAAIHGKYSLVLFSLFLKTILGIINKKGIIYKEKLEIILF